MTCNTKTLSAAACALLGASGPAHAAEANWQIDSDALYYAESNRVSVFEPVVAARRVWGEKSLGARFTLDTLTGPSPSGATPASTVQTISGPSGNGDTYTAKPGEIPLDDSFKDTRYALAVDYAAPLAGAWTADYGLNFSTEYDYQSLGGSLRLQRDFNQHNTTLAFGAAFAQDSVKPVDGAPIPLTELPAAGVDQGNNRGNAHGGGSSKSKSVADLLIGVTQVLDPHSLLRVNLVYSDISGYQTDPYKILSVVGSDGEPLRYVYERRPSSRNKAGVFAEYLRALGDDTFKISYRYLTDKWGIDSHTFETSYRLHLGASNYVEPQLRYYTQTAADFYHVALFDGQEQSLRYATADYRLGGMHTATAAVQVGHQFGDDSEMSLRVAYYLQTPDEKGVPEQAAEGLSKFGRLVPETKAVMATVGYRFGL